MSLHCGSVKPKYKTEPGYWLLWRSSELRFPKFTDNFGTVSSVSHWDNVDKMATVLKFVWNQCQGNRDIITRSKLTEHICLVLRDLHWLRISDRIIFKMLHYVYKSTTDMSPLYISQLLTPNKQQRQLRSTQKNFLLNRVLQTPGEHVHSFVLHLVYEISFRSTLRLQNLCIHSKHCWRL